MWEKEWSVKQEINPQTGKLQESVWGRLPSGDIKSYNSLEEYNQAYATDESDIYDGVYEQNNEFYVEQPEDFRT